MCGRLSGIIMILNLSAQPHELSSRHFDGNLVFVRDPGTGTTEELRSAELNCPSGAIRLEWDGA
jgi:hypothetical protein